MCAINIRLTIILFEIKITYFRTPNIPIVTDNVAIIDQSKESGRD